MSNSTGRYQKLCIEESLPIIYRYPIAYEELSFILRGAYAKLPNHLQSLIFQHTLAAFRFLPGMQTGSAVAAAHLLLRSAEAAIPKQKKSMVVAEFKQAKVAHKRRSKAHREDRGPAQLPQDVLVHIFRLLDLQSLISAGLVCCHGILRQTITIYGNRHIQYSLSGIRSKKFMSGRGYCGHCDTIVWLKNLNCSNSRCELKNESPRIKPISLHEVVAYVIDGYISEMSSSESDSESDEEFVSRLWAYPRDRRRIEKTPIVNEK